MSDDNAHYAPVEPVMTGLKGRCPRCGQGRLFDGFIKVKPSCSNCGLDYTFADSGDGPVVFVILIIGFIVLGMALWMEVNYTPPLWVHFTLWLPIAVAASLSLMRALKGILIALQYRHKAGGSTIDPG